MATTGAPFSRAARRMERASSALRSSRKATSSSRAVTTLSPSVNELKTTLARSGADRMSPDATADSVRVSSSPAVASREYRPPAKIANGTGALRANAAGYRMSDARKPTKTSGRAKSRRDSGASPSRSSSERATSAGFRVPGSVRAKSLYTRPQPRSGSRSSIADCLASCCTRSRNGPASASPRRTGTSFCRASPAAPCISLCMKRAVSDPGGASSSERAHLDVQASTTTAPTFF
eukprot:4925273-Prymnesium_polylepis.1